MLVNCRQCKALIDAGRDFCPHCFTPLKRPGMFARLIEWLFDRGVLGGFGGGSGGDDRTMVIRSHSDPIVAKSVSQRIVITDPQTAERREYTRWEDVPQQWREHIRALSDPAKLRELIGEHALDHTPIAGSANAGDANAMIDLLADDEPRSHTAQHASKSYSSLDEMPEDLRKLVSSLNLGNGEVREVRVEVGTKSATQSHIISQDSHGPRTEHSRYSFRGGDGVERTYKSLDEMPPEVRRMFEAMRREAER